MNETINTGYFHLSRRIEKYPTGCIENMVALFNPLCPRGFKSDNRMIFIGLSIKRNSSRYLLLFPFVFAIVPLLTVHTKDSIAIFQ